MGRGRFYQRVLQAQRAFWASEATRERHSDRESRRNLWKIYLDVFGRFYRFNGSERVLDVGCGPTGILIAWDNAHRFGFDPLVFDYVRSYELDGDVSYICGFGEDLPFSQNCFDVVCRFNTLDQLRNPDAVLKECYRVLVPGGYLYIGVDTYEGRAYLERAILTPFARLFGRMVSRPHILSRT